MIQRRRRPSFVPMSGQQDQFYALRGGLDLITPAIEVNPGRAIDGANYEPVERGYQRVPGYERTDGRPKPSQATYYILAFTDGDTAISEGDVLVGDESGHTGTALYDATVTSGSYGGGDAAGSVILTGIEQPEATDSFLTPSSLPSRYALTRASVGTYIDSSGDLQEAAANTGRWTYYWTGSAWAIAGLLVEGSRINLLRNNTGVGAVAGTPGTMPTNWNWSTPVASMTTHVVGSGTEKGIAYVDLRLSGTPGASGQMRIQMDDWDAAGIAAGDDCSLSAYLKLAAGSFTNVDAALRFQVLDDSSASGVLQVYRTAYLTVDGSDLSKQRISVSATIAEATAAHVRPMIEFNLTSGQAVDVTLRIGLPQIERSAKPTSAIETSSAEVTRSADLLIKTLPESINAAVTINRRNLESGFAYDYEIPAQPIATTYAVPASSNPVRTVSYEQPGVVTPADTAFFDDETLNVSASAVAVADGSASLRGASTTALDRAYTTAAATAARALIQPVPGSGPVRGVWRYQNSTWAVRDTEGGTEGALYKSSIAGWQRQVLGSQLDFDAGTAAFAEGETLTGGTSGATAEIKRVILDSGTWAGNDAAGRLILGPVSGGPYADNEAVTSASGSADADGAQAANSLPAGGRYVFETDNLTGLADRRAMYGVNGVGRGFEWDGDTFITINTGLSDALDKPIRVAIHRNHLFFGFRGGSVQFSSIGDPYTWSVVQGAGELTLGQDLTGMLSVVDGALVITGHSKVAVLYGSSSADFRLDELADESGAAAWTLMRVGVPIYLDDAGVRSLDQTEQFGNFTRGTISRLIEPLLRTMRKAGRIPVGSARFRDKDQYRLYWDDGSALAIYLGRELPECMPLDFGTLRVTCAASAVDLDALEINLVGGADGYVYETDVGTSFDGAAVAAFIRFPFHHIRRPTQVKRFHKLTLEIDSEPQLDLQVSTEVNYGSPDQPGGRDRDFVVSGGGAYWSEANWNSFYWSAQAEGQAGVPISREGTNLSMVVSSESAEDPIHTIHGVTIHYSLRRLQR